MDKMRNLSKRTDFNNLIYCYKGESASKTSVDFKDPLVFYKSIKEGHITIEKAEVKQKGFKFKLNEIVKGGKNSENHKSTINVIKTVHESREKVIKLFDDFFRILSETKCKAKYGEGLKILTPKQVLERIPVALAQIKAGDASKNLLNEMRQIIHSLYQTKEITKKVYSNIMNSIKT